MSDIRIGRKPTRRLAVLAVLGGVTALMVLLAAVAVTSQRRALTSDFQPRIMFPDLSARVNDAAKIEIASRLEQVTVLRDTDNPEVWRVVEKADYPARADMVKRTVVGLAELELVEERTAQPDWHKHINLTAPDAKGTGVRVAIYDAEGGEMAALIAGKRDGAADIDAKGSIYVRRPDAAQTYLARGAFNLTQSAAAWLDTRVIDLEPARVHSVEVTPAAGAAYAVEAVEAVLAGDTPAGATPEGGGDTGSYRIRDLPPDRQPITDYAVTGIGNALVNLRFVDVVPRSDVTLDMPVTSVFRTADGLEITVVAEKQDTTYYALFDARAAAGADAAVGEEAARLAARLAPYAFALPTTKGADMTRTLDTLTEPVTPGAPVDLDAVREDSPPSP